MSQNEPSPPNDSLAAALERNELVYFPSCPIKLPAADDLSFLLIQQMAAKGHKDIGLDPSTGRLTALDPGVKNDRTRLAEILGRCSESITEWLKRSVPAYAAGLTRDRITLRTQEEANRTLRLTARNDLLHVDNFPTRPSFGRRILRVFTNINPTDPQVWAVSEKFPELLTRFAANHEVPVRSVADWVARLGWFQRLVQRGRGRSHYDSFMQRLHHFLKQDEGFQAQAPRRMWTFPPGSTWALFADGVANAQLRGAYALEHSFFVPVDSLSNRADAPLSLLISSPTSSPR